jgi:hypothetical protein
MPAPQPIGLVRRKIVQPVHGVLPHYLVHHVPSAIPGRGHPADQSALGQHAQRGQGRTGDSFGPVPTEAADEDPEAAQHGLLLGGQPRPGTIQHSPHAVVPVRLPVR